MLTVTVGFEASGKSSTCRPLGRWYSVMPSTVVTLRMAATGIGGPSLVTNGTWRVSLPGVPEGMVPTLSALAGPGTNAMASAAAASAAGIAARIAAGIAASNFAFRRWTVCMAWGMRVVGGESRCGESRCDIL